MFSTTSLEQVTLEVGAICLSTCNLPVGWCVEPPPCSLSLSLNSPSQRLPWLTVCWFHTGGCYTVRPLWTCVPGSPAPWTPWRTWSGNLCRPLRNLAAAALCLSVIGFTQHNSKIVHFFERLLLQHYKHSVFHEKPLWSLQNYSTVYWWDSSRGRSHTWLGLRYSRGTQEPNLSGNSEMRSSLIRSFIGPSTMTGRV